jgi:DNA-directed RNA polymerase specialized sigma24 family protein
VTIEPFAAGAGEGALAGGDVLTARPTEELPPFEDVYQAQVRTVYRLCLSRLDHADDAEDLTAEVFADAF